MGVGGRLVSLALNAERAAGRKIEVVCPFVSGYLQRHPEYNDLVG
jgi:predicted GNAT family acetyltransferase